jgi:hypothetical protein
MIRLPRDALWHMLRRVRRKWFLELRLVCSDWRQVIDSVLPSEWRDMFEEIVGVPVPSVGSRFDWKRAVVRASAKDECVIALCVWMSMRIPVASPWDGSAKLLRRGVRRGAGNQHYIDFLYDNTLRLRGLKRSCYHRNAPYLCFNCKTRARKRRCLNPQYDYFIRGIQENDDSRNTEVLLLNVAYYSMQTPRGSMASVVTVGPS